MSTLTAHADARIDASPDLILEIIRDFDGHHRHILPPAFSDFRVLEGGYGAGTVTSFTTTLGGKAIPGRTVVSEPAPGVVREEVIGRDMVTEFRVAPDRDGAHVEIHTSWTPSPGLGGIAERLLVRGMLARLYRQELVLLRDYAREIGGYRAAAVGA